MLMMHNEMLLIYPRFFSVVKDGHVVSTQEGVYRTNCIDCLDRTNVVQNMLARRILQNKLLVSHFSS